jgi:capsular polysaccharide biosynthesis protein/Mrp family chromosome partitioning ATPase
VSEPPNELEFRPALLRDALRRHVWLILGLTLVFAALAGVAGTQVPTTHRSSAVVLVNPLYGNPFSPGALGDQLTNLETEAQLVSTDAVAAIAATALNTAVPPSELVRTARATVTTNTQVIKVTYQAPTADAAQDRAQAFAEAYLTFRSQRAKDLIAGQVKLLRQQADSTRDLLVKATKQIGTGKASAGPAFATEQVRTYTAELTRLTSQIAEEQAIPTDPGQVISPADRPADVALSAGILYGSGGLLLGLIIGILTAIARERMDDRIRSSDDLDRLPITTLGEMKIPLNWSPTFAPVPEDHRRVRTTLLGTLPEVPATIVIGRPGTSTQAPTIIGALAVALIRSEVRVCVIDSAANEWLGQDLVPRGETGLANVLLSDVPVESVLQQPVPGLWVVPRGHWSDEAADRLGNMRMRRAIASLRQQFDLVILCASGIENADSQVLARMADSVILECTPLSTKNADLLRAVEQLGRAGVGVMGGVLVQPASTRRRFARTRRHAGVAVQSGPDRNESVLPRLNGTSQPSPNDGHQPDRTAPAEPGPNRGAQLASKVPFGRASNGRAQPSPRESGRPGPNDEPNRTSKPMPTPTALKTASLPTPSHPHGSASGTDPRSPGWVPVAGSFASSGSGGATASTDSSEAPPTSGLPILPGGSDRSGQGRPNPTPKQTRPPGQDR